LEKVSDFGMHFYLKISGIQKAIQINKREDES